MKKLLIAVVAVFALLAVAYLAVRDNFHPVVSGEVYRSAQLSPARLKDAIQKNGIRTVLNLRPVHDHSNWYPPEVEATNELGADHVTIGMLRSSARIRNVLDIYETLQSVEQPVLVHCRSGIDRTGLASVMSLLMRDGFTPDDAAAQVSWRYGAFADTIGRPFLEQYRSWLGAEGATHSPQVFENWLYQDYVDPTGNVYFLVHPIRGQAWHRPLGRGDRFEVRRSESPLLELDGWAIDSRKQELLAGVSLTLGGKPMSRAEYGIHFPWLSDTFDDPALLDSGWAVMHSLYSVEDGCHDLRITFTRQDGSSWESPPAGKICVSQ